VISVEFFYDKAPEIVTSMVSTTRQDAMRGQPSFGHACPG
jgi:hypothetical protein